MALEIAHNVIAFVSKKEKEVDKPPFPLQISIN
jgi:hypothetical protein